MVYFLSLSCCVLGFTLGIFSAFLCGSKLGLLQKLSLDNYRYLNGFRPVWDAMKNSILLATLTATAAMVLTSLIAWIVYKSRLPGAWLLDFLALPSRSLFGHRDGHGIDPALRRIPIPIYGTIWMLLIAYVTRFIPYGMRSASGSIMQIHSELEEAGRGFWGFWWETFRARDVAATQTGLRRGVDLHLHVSFREFSTSVLLATGESRVLSICCLQCSSRGKSRSWQPWNIDDPDLLCIVPSSIGSRAEWYSDLKLYSIGSSS